MEVCAIFIKIKPVNPKFDTNITTLCSPKSSQTVETRLYF